jgi:hypothetical protein
VPATLVVEITMFLAGLGLYASTRRPRASFWALMILLFVLYLGAVFGPPPPNVKVLALSGLAGWILMPWAWWADRER